MFSSQARAGTHGSVRGASFVQTEDARNAAFYGKLGFETVEYISPQDEPLGIPVWLMTRQSRHR